MRSAGDDAEVIVVGGGHNGLICGAYLARSGVDTLLVESRSSVGGCASTERDLGARFNICNCDHVMIRAMPVVEELELDSHGLRYLEPESGFIHLFHDDGTPWIHFHEVEQTLDGLARTHPAAVDGYRRYVSDALPVAALILEMARAGVGARRFLAGAAAKRAKGAARLLEWSRRSTSEVLARYFDDWRLTMPAVATGPTVWGVAPETPGTGLAAALYATRHLIKSGRPEGGSGALTEAVRSSLEAAGGRVRCGETVERLLVEDGAIVGVRLRSGDTLRAPMVVAACDPQRVFVDWLDEVPSGARRVVNQWRSQPVYDGYESKVDAVLGGLPRYRAADRLAESHPDIDPLSATAIICPNPEQLAEAHAGLSEGRVADTPTMLVNVPSVLDPSMKSDDGLHILSLEVLFTPYGLQGGWPRSSEPQRWLDRWSDLTDPGSMTIDRWRAMTPDRYETEFSMHRGHTPAYAGSPLAAFIGHHPEVSRYRTPISGLYLSGAATFPGAGVFGAPGRNAAAAVNADLRQRGGRELRRTVDLVRNRMSRR